MSTSSGPPSCEGGGVHQLEGVVHPPEGGVVNPPEGGGESSLSIRDGASE